MKRLSISLIPVAVLTIGPANVAFADMPQGLQLRASAGVEHDDNVLRQGSGQIADNIGILSAGLKYDKNFSLQHVRADVEATAYRYQDTTNLNYSTLNYALAWDWSLTPHFHGVASADRRQFRDVTTDPVTFANFVGKRTERNEVLEGTADIGARLRALAGVTHTEAKSTEPHSWDASPSVSSARVGVGYETPKGSLVTLKYRRGDGEYTDPTPGSAAGDFKENETELALHWPVTIKTSVNARIAHLQRRHDISPQLDFSGTVGGADVNWEITGKTRLIAGYAHDLVASGQGTGGHVETDRIYLTPVWQATPAIGVNFRLDRSERRWKEVPVGAPDFGRSEHIQYAQVGVDWTPRPILTVSGYLREERLSSNLPGASYSASVVGVAAKATF